MRVLVVDDDDNIREFVAIALCDEGYEATVAADGVEALAVSAEMPPDLILLDMRMPVMDGYEFSRVYRQRPGPHAPIVVLTAAGRAAETAREIEAVDCLGKPFELDALLEMVARYDNHHA